MKKIVAILLCVILALSTFAGCEENATYDNYSYGLDDSGLYLNMSNYNGDVTDFSNVTYACEDILNWGFEYLNSSSEEPAYESVDDYVRQYAKEFLAALNLTYKDVVEEGDVCSLNLTFSVDGEVLEDYSSTANYAADSSGDTIVSSLIGRNSGDQYNVEYVFPEDVEEYAGKTADVDIVINYVTIGDPLEAGVVESNLDIISEYFDNVTDTESFIHEIQPQMARSILDMYISENIDELSDFEVPGEYVDYEMYRMKARLQQLGYGYKEYLELSKSTEEEVRGYCESIAKENYFCMLIYDNVTYKITEDVAKSYFGDDYDYLVEVQGLPYVKLRIIRDYTLVHAASQIALTYDGDIVEFDGESMMEEYEESFFNYSTDDVDEHDGHDHGSEEIDATESDSTITEDVRADESVESED